MSYSSEVLADSPYAFYKLDETSGTTMNDSSGNSRNGTFGGSPTLAQTDLIGDGGTSVLFGASGDYGLGSAIFNVSHASVEVVFDYDGTPPSAGNYWAIAGCHEGGSGNSNEDKMILIDSSGHAVFYTFDGGAKFAVGATVLSAGRYHLVGTVDGSTSTIYVNGTADGTVGSSGSFTGYGANNLLIAGQGNTTTHQFKAGKRDVAAWYGTTLTSTRVAAHFAAISFASAYTDAATATLKLSPSSSEVYTPGGILDAGTATLKLSPSSTDLAQYIESSTATLKLIPSGVDARVSTDSGTAVLKLVPSSIDCYCLFSPDFIGYFMTKWRADDSNKWFADDSARWSGDLIEEGVVLVCSCD